MQATVQAFGPLLRQWRQARRMSQMELAGHSEVSTRHISFVENGKASPSREMVLVLASALEIPLRERNALLGSAGFAPVYRESQLSDPDMAPVKQAVDIILEHQEPYPAVVVDRTWNLLKMNRAATKLYASFLEPPFDPIVMKNVMHATFNPTGIRKVLVNFDEVAGTLIDRLYREAMVEPEGSPPRKLLDELLQYDVVPPRLRDVDLAHVPSVTIPIHLKKDNIEARLITAITTLGTPLDVTVQELRIESYFPADDATKKWIESLA